MPSSTRHSSARDTSLQLQINIVHPIHGIQTQTLIPLVPTTCTSSGKSNQMKLIVTIKAGDATQNIVLPVGHGTQSFKWLANAVAFRFIHDSARHGHGNLSSNSRQQYSLPLNNANLMPKDVYSDNCPFFHPEDIIKDHVTDGQSITVELYDTLPLDDYGIPKLSHWAFIAFRHRESHEGRRESYVQEKRAEVENFQIEREHQAKVRQIEIERPKLEKIREILADQLIDNAVSKSSSLCILPVLSFCSNTHITLCFS